MSGGEIVYGGTYTLTTYDLSSLYSTLDYLP